MRILVDGDACPQKEEIAKLAREYDIHLIVYMDYAHISYQEDYEVKQCEVGRDQVDMMIVNDVQKGDLVITQDFGLATLVLAKKAYVLHISGMRIHQENIDELMFRRYVGQKVRKANKHVNGPSKRTDDDKKYFLKQLELMIKEILMWDK